MFWEVHEDDNNQSFLISSWHSVLAVIKQDITAYFLMIKITQIESQLLIIFLARLMSLTENPNNLPLRLFLKELLVDRRWCKQENRLLNSAFSVNLELIFFLVDLCVPLKYLGKRKYLGKPLFELLESDVVMLQLKTSKKLWRWCTLCNCMLGNFNP